MEDSNVIDAGREEVHVGSRNRAVHYAAIRRDVVRFALEAGVGSDWHESGLTARLGGSEFVDNACPLQFEGEHAEAFLELRDGDGNALRVNLADLLASLTGEVMEAVRLDRRCKA